MDIYVCHRFSSIHHSSSHHSSSHSSSSSSRFHLHHSCRCRHNSSSNTLQMASMLLRFSDVLVLLLVRISRTLEGQIDPKAAVLFVVFCLWVWKYICSKTVSIHSSNSSHFFTSVIFPCLPWLASCFSKIKKPNKHCSGNQSVIASVCIFDMNPIFFLK